MGIRIEVKSSEFFLVSRTENAECCHNDSHNDNDNPAQGIEEESKYSTGTKKAIFILISFRISRNSKRYLVLVVKLGLPVVLPAAVLN